MAPRMKHRPHHRRLLSLALLAALGAAQAQSERCTAPPGVRGACALHGGTRMGSYGPHDADEALPALRESAVRLPALARAPDHQGYMSSTCSSLRDGLRTASARGTSAATVADLQADYAVRCRDDEAQAIARWQQDRQRAAEQRQQFDAEHRAEAARHAQAQHQQVAQCGEIRRILARRHERIASLTPGELNDLRRFEAVAAERCPTPRP